MEKKNDIGSNSKLNFERNWNLVSLSLSLLMIRRRKIKFQLASGVVELKGQPQSGARDLDAEHQISRWAVVGTCRPDPTARRAAL